MARRTLTGSRVLVTGASSGIGRALAVRLGAAGAHLLLTARRIERLRELSDELHSRGVEVRLCEGDLTVAETRQRLAVQVAQNFQGLDLLVNCAGLGAIGAFQQANESRLRRIMEVNFFAPVELIRQMLPYLKRGRSPLIVNVGSVLGHVAVPKKSEYCASKFALRGLTDALRCELRSEGIEILWVAPNTTRSEFFDQLLEREGQVAVNPLSSSPDQVARHIERAIRRGRMQRILTLSGRNLIRAQFFFPRLVARCLSRFG